MNPSRQALVERIENELGIFGSITERIADFIEVGRKMMIKHWIMITLMAFMFSCEQEQGAFARGHSYKSARSSYGKSIRVPKSWNTVPRPYGRGLPMEFS